MAPILLVPAGFVGGALKSIAGSFLGGGVLRVLVNPYTIMFIAFGGSLGWAYHKGKQHERINQAKAIIELNKNLVSWKRAYEEADDIAEKRLQIALQNWRKQAGPAVVMSASCKLPPNAVNAINDIAGD